MEYTYQKAEVGFPQFNVNRVMGHGSLVEAVDERGVFLTGFDV